MSHNSKSNHFSCSEVAILILVSRAGTTGIGGAAGAAAPPIPVPARLTGIKIATTEQLHKQINSVTNAINFQKS